MIGHGVPGLYIQQSYAFPVAPGAVFAALTTGLNGWWPVGWRQTGPQSTVSLSPEIGAAMTEVGPAGSAAIWGWVEVLKPPHVLHLQGHFGVDGAVAGRVQFEIAETPEGCTLTVLHLAIGPVPEDRGAKYRGAWREALDRGLRGFLAGTCV